MAPTANPEAAPRTVPPRTVPPRTVPPRTLPPRTVAPPIVAAPPTRAARHGAPSAVAAGIGALLSATLLTAAATWLLVTAAGRPPVLTLSVAAVLVRASAITRPLLGHAERLLAHDTALRRLADWRSAVVADLIPRVPGPLTGGRRRGDLLVRVVEDVDARLDGLLRGRQPLLVLAGTLLVVLTGTAVLTAPVVAGAALPGLVVAGLLAPALAARTERDAGRRARAAQACSSHALEVLDAVEDLRTLPVDPLVPLQAAGSRLREVERRQHRVVASAQAVGLLGCGAAVLGATLAAAAAGTSPVATAVVLLAGVVAVDPLRSAPDAVRAVRRGRAAEARAAELATQPVGTVEPVVPQAVPSGSGRRGLRLEGVTAGWRPDVPVLRGVDLALAPGSVTVLRGASGSGKSTLAAVLLRLLDPVGGRVLLGGVDTTTLAGDDVRSRVGSVGDDEHVFATSLRDNLRLAAPAADDAHLRHALHRVRLDDWFAALPAGLDSRLGDGGATTSGGERHRLALARALLTDVDVLVLDEPGEGLDETGAAALLGELLDAARADGRAVVVLAHRGEALRSADQVYDLVDGRIRAGRVHSVMGDES